MQSALSSSADRILRYIKTTFFFILLHSIYIIIIIIVILHLDDNVIKIIGLLVESLHDFRPMLGAGSSSEVELLRVFMGTGLWQGGAD